MLKHLRALANVVKSRMCPPPLGTVEADHDPIKIEMDASVVNLLPDELAAVEDFAIKYLESLARYRVALEPEKESPVVTS